MMGDSGGWVEHIEFRSKNATLPGLKSVHLAFGLALMLFSWPP
jgi:hypothetical protein